MFITVENAWVLQVSVLLGLAVGIIASWIDSYIRRPSAPLLAAHQRRAEVQRQLGEVKSVQLEFVRHSMLSRELIKAEKAVESASTADAARLAGRLSLVSKAKIALTGVVFAILYGRPAISTDANLFWPFSRLILTRAPAVSPSFFHGAAAEPVPTYLVPAFIIACASYAAAGLLARLAARLTTPSARKV